MSALDVALASAPAYDEATLGDALARLGEALGWSNSRGPLGAVVSAGARVVVKPNWVLERNRGPWGLEPLVTHPALIRTAVRALLATEVAGITVGDAPLQTCDFDRLLAEAGLDAWARELAAREPRFLGIHDFRRTKSAFEAGALQQREAQRDLAHFVLFDLGPDSLLEPVATPAGRFRVTQYDPELMRRTHSPGRHQYLVARELIEADVVVNLPKLKTHRKAGMTGALKNLVGINGNKEYLPHHRVGGAAAGGDCYPGRSVLKRLHEHALDLQNGARSILARRALGAPARVLSFLSRLWVDSLGVEGAWAGNDTVWRMTLDLNRILLYGRPDGTLTDEPQRRVITIMDAVTVGQGDGPLAAEGHAMGVLLAGESSAAVDWVGAAMLGYDPARIATVREAFGQFRWPLAAQPAGAVREVPVALRARPMPATRYPAGWLAAVRRDARTSEPEGVVFRANAASAGQGADA